MSVYTGSSRTTHVQYGVQLPVRTPRDVGLYWIIKEDSRAVWCPVTCEDPRDVSLYWIIKEDSRAVWCPVTCEDPRDVSLYWIIKEDSRAVWCPVTSEDPRDVSLYWIIKEGPRAVWCPVASKNLRDVSLYCIIKEDSRAIWSPVTSEDSQRRQFKILRVIAILDVAMEQCCLVGSAFQASQIPWINRYLGTSVYIYTAKSLTYVKRMLNT